MAQGWGGISLTGVATSGNLMQLYPVWAASAPGTYYYSFTVSSASATAGATYTNNGATFTVIYTIASATTLIVSGTGAPGASGTLTKASGTGDSTITFSAAAFYPFAQRAAAIPTTAGQLYRRPAGGQFGQISVETDGTDGGTIQLYDINGLDVGADVSSNEVITNAQLITGIVNRFAKPLWEQNFAASPGATLVWNWSQGFLRGLAARFVGSGTCKLNVIGDGGFQYLVSAGVYSGG